MTFFKKYMALVIGGGIALLLALVVLVLLIKFSGGYARIQDELTSNQRELERLTGLETFPSIENVDRVDENLIELKAFRDNLLATMSAHQPAITDMERVAFPPELERTWQRLRTKAARQNVVIPADMRFGFERYAAGNLPMQQHVPRLLSQLYSVDRVGEILIRSGIAELTGVEREIFEEQRQPVAEEPVGRRRGAADPAPVAAPTVTAVDPAGVEGLFSRERFTFTFMASEAALIQVLNELSQDPVLKIVRNIELRNEMGLGGISAAARLSSRLQPREAATRPGEVTDRTADATREATLEDRVVAGRERVQVRMVLDVYRFEFEVEEEEIE